MRHSIRNIALVLLAGAFLTAPAAFAVTTPVRSYQDVKFAPINWKKPAPEVVKLKNGATVYLLEDHRLPLVNFAGSVRTGSLYDPQGKNGTAAMVGTLLRTGGTKKRSWEQVDQDVDRLAMSVTTGIGKESGNASFDVLSENFAPALNLLFEMLREPAFDPAKLDVAKEKTKEGIRRQNDNPIQIALREMGGILYGQDHPRGFSPTFKTVDAITREDLVAFHAKYYCPSNMILGVAGDFDRKKVIQQIETAMGAWPNKTVTLPEVPSIELKKARAVYEADKESATQSTILVTRLTVKQGNPDQYPMEVMDHLLGSGGFNSRITKAVRNDRGLAYAAGSALQVGTLDPGPEIIYALSKGESTVEALDVMLKETERMRSEAVPAADLERARSALLNGAVFDYDSPEKIIGETLDLSYYGLPQDLPEKRLKALEMVTAADVQRVARENLDPETLQILVVGAKSKFEKPLTEFGPVTTIELKDPTIQ